MKAICIIGAAGNMGKRYSAICDSEDIPYISVDREDSLPRPADGISHYIIATPTSTHGKVLIDLTNLNPGYLKVLVEKPFAIMDNLKTGLAPIEHARSHGHTVYMVNQYAYYSHGLTEEAEGPTHYDYYNSGKDGAAWDCIQLIHLAKSNVEYLQNENPIWDCMINGMKLNRELIDLCYVKMIKDFATDGTTYGRLWGWKDIKAAHRKVIAYEKSAYRGTGTQ